MKCSCVPRVLLDLLLVSSCSLCCDLTLFPFPHQLCKSQGTAQRSCPEEKETMSSAPDVKLGQKDSPPRPLDLCFEVVWDPNICGCWHYPWAFLSIVSMKQSPALCPKYFFNCQFGSGWLNIYLSRSLPSLILTTWNWLCLIFCIVLNTGCGQNGSKRLFLESVCLGENTLGNLLIWGPAKSTTRLTHLTPNPTQKPEGPHNYNHFRERK